MKETPWPLPPEDEVHTFRFELLEYLLRREDGGMRGGSAAVHDQGNRLHVISLSEGSCLLNSPLPWIALDSLQVRSRDSNTADSLPSPLVLTFKDLIADPGLTDICESSGRSESSRLIDEIPDGVGPPS
eukprot:gene4757-6047_t